MDADVLQKSADESGPPLHGPPSAPPNMSENTKTATAATNPTDDDRAPATSKVILQMEGNYADSNSEDEIVFVIESSSSREGAVEERTISKSTAIPHLQHENNRRVRSLLESSAQLTESNLNNYLPQCSC
jgi:hypothetical protein